MQITTTNRGSNNVAWTIYRNAADMAELSTTIKGVDINVIVRGESIEIITQEVEVMEEG